MMSRNGIAATAAMLTIGMAVPMAPSAGQQPATAVADSAEQPPTRDEIEVDRGGRLMQEGKWDEAILLFGQVLRRSPRNGDALANRALAYGWTNRLAEAERDLRAAEAIIPRSVGIHRVRAVIADRRSDDALVIAEMTKVLEMEPGDEMALQFRANTYQANNREAEAMADADAYVRTHPDDIDAHVFKARLAIRQQKMPIAGEEAARLKAEFPDDAYALASSARIYDDLGRRDQAMELITGAIVIDPEAQYYHYLRAGMRRWDDLSGRKADLETSLALDPNDLATVTRLGWVAYRRGDWSEAVRFFTQVLDKESNDHGVKAYRGMAFLNAGDSSRAQSDFDGAMRAASGPDDFSLVCWALGRENRALDRAVEACDRAVAMKQDESAYLGNRAIVRLRQGQLAAALADFDAAVKADDRLADNYLGRAIVRQRLGDANGSSADRTRALAIDPTVEEEFEEFGLSVSH
jgi:tetratricopeptide (TPR) repeat protein